MYEPKGDSLSPNSNTTNSPKPLERTVLPKNSNDQFGAPARIYGVDLEKGQLEIHVLDSFLQIYLPQSSTISSNFTLKDPWLTQWRSIIVTTSNNSVLVRKTIAALGLSCLGNQSSDMPMIHQGTKLYGIVLTQLNETLRNSCVVPPNANVTAAIQLMGLYEQFNGFSSSASISQSLNWQAHVLGMKKLFEMSGPYAFMTEPAFSIFRACQTAQFASAFAARKATTLSASQWRTIPWLQHEKDARDLLFDVAFQLPAMVERADGFDNAKSEQDIVQLLIDLQNLRSQLEAWRSGFTSEFELSPDSIENEDIGLHIPDSYSMADRQIVILFCSIQVHTIILMRNMIRLLESIDLLKYSFGHSDTDVHVQVRPCLDAPQL